MTVATTAILWRKKRRRNSCHCERASGSASGDELELDVRQVLVAGRHRRVRNVVDTAKIDGSSRDVTTAGSVGSSTP